MSYASYFRSLILFTAFGTSLFGFADEGFGDKKGCILVQELSTGKVVYESSSELCKERIYPCSTFKVPLALMAFDQGIIKDENTAFKWNQSPQIVKSWEHDQTARSWLENSVVWVSQKI